MPSYVLISKIWSTVGYDGSIVIFSLISFIELGMRESLLRR